MSNFNEKSATCHICLNYEFLRYTDRVCNKFHVSDLNYRFECSICGEYKVIDVADKQLPKDNLQLIKNCESDETGDHLPIKVKKFENDIYLAESDDQLPLEVKDYALKMRSAVSHKFKQNTLSGQDNIIYGNKRLFEHFKNAELPSRKKQTDSIIRYIGKECDKLGGLKLPVLPVDFHSIIGTLNRDSSLDLISQLIDEGFVDCENSRSVSKEDYKNFYLTVAGQEKCEELDHKNEQCEREKNITVVLTGQNNEDYNFKCYERSASNIPQVPGVFCYAISCSKKDIVYIGEALNLGDPNERQIPQKDWEDCINDRDPAYILVHPCNNSTFVKETLIQRNNPPCGPNFWKTQG